MNSTANNKGHLDAHIAPALLLVIHSPRWQSQMRQVLRGFGFCCDVQWQLSIEQAASLCQDRANQDAALVLELPANFATAPEQTLLQIARLCNNPQQCPLLLLGDDSVEPWSDILREVGAADLCTSMLRFEKFGQRVARHLENHLRSELTVEQTVAARLPW